MFVLPDPEAPKESPLDNTISTKLSILNSAHTLTCIPLPKTKVNNQKTPRHKNSPINRSRNPPRQSPQHSRLPTKQTYHSMFQIGDGLQLGGVNRKHGNTQ
jgi:hypothetical protein